jgi:hypothetical protein
MTIFASRARRLDRRVKELTQEKEELLKSSKVQSTTMESVKVQIETLLKVRLVRICVQTSFIQHFSFRPRQKSARRSKNSFLLPQFRPMTPIRVNGSLPGLLSRLLACPPLLSSGLPYGSRAHMGKTAMDFMDATTYNLGRQKSD